MAFKGVMSVAMDGSEKLDRPILPPYLYRYRKLSDERCGFDERFIQEIDAITNQYLYCSAYRAMNDPMEGFYEPTARFQKDTVFRKTVRQILDAKRGIGICCFTDTHDNELMWTHYAQNYTGICVGYRSKRLLEALPPDAHLLRVAYGGKPPVIGRYDVNVPEATASKILSHKKSSWVYEREWRILWQQGRMPILGPDVIGEIRLGSLISREHRDRLLENFSQSGIRIYEMKIVGYEHDWKPLNRKLRS